MRFSSTFMQNSIWIANPQRKKLSRLYFSLIFGSNRVGALNWKAKALQTWKHFQRWTKDREKRIKLLFRLFFQAIEAIEAMNLKTSFYLEPISNVLWAIKLWKEAKYNFLFFHQADQKRLSSWCFYWLFKYRRGTSWNLKDWRMLQAFQGTISDVWSLVKVENDVQVTFYLKDESCTKDFVKGR